MVVVLCIGKTGNLIGYSRNKAITTNNTLIIVRHLTPTAKKLYNLKIISFLFFVISINLLHSQTINGVVKDSVTGETIAFSNIVLKNGKGTYSSESGIFQLELKNIKTDTLKVSTLGYHSKILTGIDFKNPSKLEVLLKPKIVSLDEVLIASTKIKYNNKIILGERKEGNISVTSLIGYETALFIDNPKKIKGQLNRIYIDLKNRRDAEYIATFNIKFYNLDTVTNKPGKELYSKNFYVKPKNKNYRLWVNVTDLKMPFPENGMYVGVEMVNTYGKVKKYAYFGPQYRYTINENNKPLTWSNYHNSGWKTGSIDYKNKKKMKEEILNPMFGIEVLFPKK